MTLLGHILLMVALLFHIVLLCLEVPAGIAPAMFVFRLTKAASSLLDHGTKNLGA